MKLLIRKLILLTITFIIVLSSSILVLKLYKCESSFNANNWTYYCDEELNFDINHQKNNPIIKKSLSDNYILAKITIPINSFGILKNKYINYCINIIDKNHFKTYFNKNNFIILNKNINTCGEKYIYAMSLHKNKSYFFLYNDYVFEIKEPLLGYSFEDSKINEITKTILIPSFKRNMQ